MLEPKTPEEIKKSKQEEEAQLKRLQKLTIAYKHLFDGTNGKIVLNDLRKRCFVDISTFVPNSNETILNEGKREVFLHILTMAGMDILKLKKEV